MLAQHCVGQPVSRDLHWLYGLCVVSVLTGMMGLSAFFNSFADFFWLGSVCFVPARLFSDRDSVLVGRPLLPDMHGRWATVRETLLACVGVSSVRGGCVAW